MIGITNGIDYAYCNPATDAALVSRYDAEDARTRAARKASSCVELGFELEPDRPLVAALGPLTQEKGFDLAGRCAAAISEAGSVLVIAGRGSERDDLAAPVGWQRV